MSVIVDIRKGDRVQFQSLHGGVVLGVVTETYYSMLDAETRVIWTVTSRKNPIYPAGYVMWSHQHDPWFSKRSA